MRNRILRIIAALAAFLLIYFLFSMVNAFTGNPISAAIASSKIKAYVKETYPKMELTISKTSYNFKDCDYYSYIQSKTSKDTRFCVSVRNGKINDSYTDDVTRHMTTYNRLSQEFNKTIEDLIKKDFPYKTSIVIGDLGKTDTDFSNLTPDMPYDPTNLPIDSAISVYTYSKDLTYEELSKRLLVLKSIMQKHKIPVSTYSLVLEKTSEKDEKPHESLYLYDFPAQKIASDNLIETIKLHQQNWEQENKK